MRNVDRTDGLLELGRTRATLQSTGKRLADKRPRVFDHGSTVRQDNKYDTKNNITNMIPDHNRDLVMQINADNNF